MRIFLRLCFLTFAATGVLSHASAQITITAADVQTRFAVGNAITTNGDTLTTTLDVGGPGARTWNFSGLLSHTTSVLTSVAPASTPYFAQFPTATHALETTAELQGIVGTVYQYFVLSTNLLNPGMMGGATTGLGTITLKTTNTPWAIYYALPSTLGTNWTTTYTDSTTISLGEYPLSQTVNVYSESYLVDAYGPMTMPGGTAYDALRLKSTEIYGPDTLISYIFLAKSGASVIVSVAPASPQKDGLVTVDGISWTGALPVDVKIVDTAPEKFALLQNYPNPFNPTTTITYQVPNTGNVSVTIYNMLGEEVATLVDGTRTPGTYMVRWDASSVPSGAYLVRMQSGEFTQSQRVMLVR